MHREMCMKGAFDDNGLYLELLTYGGLDFWDVNNEACEW